jgi:hypothetical protein
MAFYDLTWRLEKANKFIFRHYCQKIICKNFFKFKQVFPFRFLLYLLELCTVRLFCSNFEVNLLQLTSTGKCRSIDDN